MTAATAEYLPPVSLADGMPDEFSLPALVSADDLPDRPETLVFIVAMLILMGLGLVVGQWV